MLEWYQNFLSGIYDLFDYLNGTFFDGQIKATPVITLQEDKRATTLGWCSCQKVWHASVDGEMDSYYEINLTSQFLNRKREEVAATLLHEMVHLYANENGLRDCTKAGVHNRTFKMLSEEHGLLVKEKTNKGWNQTELSEDSQQKLTVYWTEHPFAWLYRDGKTQPSVRTGARKSIGLRCPVCGYKLRTTNDKILIYCKKCEVPLEPIGRD